MSSNYALAFGGIKTQNWARTNATVCPPVMLKDTPLNTGMPLW